MRKLREFIRNNLIVFVFAGLSLVLELQAMVNFNCAPVILSVGYPLYLLLTMIGIVSVFHNRIISGVAALVILIVQSVILIGSDLLYLANGMVFERSLLKQRNDAIATIEQLSIDKGLVLTCLVLVMAYALFLIGYSLWCKKHDCLNKHSGKEERIAFRTIVIIMMVGIKVIPMGVSSDEVVTSLTELLYQPQSSYQNMGVTSKVIYELSQDAILQVEGANLDAIEEFIYSEKCDTSKYFGISQGNNLIMILAESLEWFPLEIYSEEITKTLYPNLTKLVGESTVFDNFYSKEKTDNAEALMMVGSNPVGQYIHNDFYDNYYPYSIANLIKNQSKIEGDNSIAFNSFHQNMGDFYNRDQAHLSFGFDKFYDIDQMSSYGLENTWETIQHERTLDSLTIATMKDEMFKTDERFFSFWISFSSHGYYGERDNLKEYYDLFDQLGVFPGGSEYEDYLRTYSAAICDFDRAIGIMMVDLEQKDLLENTTIAIISDHNAYYNKLTNYVKGIDNYYEPELYRVPMIIYDQKLVEAMTNYSKATTISKFATTSDVIPTLMDVMGIEGWKNLYLGTTLFINEPESIIYSRAYNVFLDDSYFAYSMSDIRYGDQASEPLAQFEAKALDHLERLQVLNEIIYSDYFATNQYRSP